MDDVQLSESEELGRVNMNELRNNQHMTLDLCVCLHVCVCLFPHCLRVCVCAGRGRTREQFPAPGEIYCISSKMADAGESMGVYIRESIPRGTIARFTISKTCTTVISSLPRCWISPKSCADISLAL